MTLNDSKPDFKGVVVEYLQNGTR